MIDVRIRRATVDDAVAIARVRVESWRTTYRGMIPQAYLDAMTVEASATLWDKSLSAGSERSQVFVAEDADGVLGFSAGIVLPEPKLGFDADLAAVYLRPAYQRLGLGSKLLGVTAAALAAQKAASLIVWVIAPATGPRATSTRQWVQNSLSNSLFSGTAWISSRRSTDGATCLRWSPVATPSPCTESSSRREFEREIECHRRTKHDDQDRDQRLRPHRAQRASRTLRGRQEA